MSSGGDGSSSSMAIYGQSAGTSAGCVMSLSQMQAMYLLGRALKWDNQQNELWDETAAGYVSDPKSFAVVTWYV